ncbi:cholecystokinin receptor type A-like [Lycorma delicatula]|uniref:cholecystokinin receptor type A-like n=1 Tax=Lycorma delicatula TaxID=130591 RepID=UPI003F50DFD9
MTNEKRDWFNDTWLMNIINVTDEVQSTNVTVVSDQGGGPSVAIISLYVAIFILAVSGNTLVLVTLAQNKRMRTVTNVYLLNLAVSDLLLGVFCVPFTLVGQVLRNFIFGALMCKLIPYFQAVSVSVGVWTLVAISLERYFAICRPLQSRRWQTQFHAYKMIACVWLASLTCNAPILLVSRLQALKGQGYYASTYYIDTPNKPVTAFLILYNFFLYYTLNKINFVIFLSV